MAWVFWGLALVWGQTATAWKWHAAAESLDATPTPSYIPKWGWVRVLGDTVYIMGTYTGNNQRLGLPTTGSPMSTAFPEGTRVRAYLPCRLQPSKWPLSLVDVVLPPFG